MAVLTGTAAKRAAWIQWLGRCRGGRFVDQHFFGKTIGGVPEPWADAVVALELAFRATGYHPRSAWAYNFRGIGGAHCSCSNYGSCSLHANGIAIDIDPVLNPYKSTSTFRWSDTAFTPTQIAAVEGIKNTKGEQVWEWGGRWRTIKDYMHFEARVDPSSTEIDWSTVPGKGSNPIGVTMSFLPLEHMDRISSAEAKAQRSDVAAIQALMNRAFGAGLKTDGLYGNATAAAVAKYLPDSNDKDGKVFFGNRFDDLMWALCLKAARSVSAGTGVDSTARRTADQALKLVTDLINKLRKV